MKTLSLVFALLFSALSFAEIKELGLKSDFRDQDSLMKMPDWAFTGLCPCCSHLKFFPTKDLESGQALVVGITKKEAPEPKEMLFLIENDADVKNIIKCGDDDIVYYLIDSTWLKLGA